MSPATRQQFGPYSLNTEKDADILAALEAVGDGNKIGFVRACVRLAMGADLDGQIGRFYGPEYAVHECRCPLSVDEWALIEKARGTK
jgi:hypothetical protein